MVEEAYRRCRGPVAYLDESYQVSDPVVAPAEPETCIIAFRVPVDADDHDGEVARRACYRGLAVALTGGGAGAWSPVELLVLEERNQNNFRNKDRKNHKELIAEKRIPQPTRLLQTSPGVERLLWLPDLVSSAFRRSITHTDDTRT